MIKEDGIRIVNEHHDIIRNREEMMLKQMTEDEYWNRRNKKEFRKDCILSFLSVISILLSIYFIAIIMYVMQ